jgi:hypothetical protein
MASTEVMLAGVLVAVLLLSEISTLLEKVEKKMFL